MPSNWVEVNRSVSLHLLPLLLRSHQNITEDILILEKAEDHRDLDPDQIDLLDRRRQHVHRIHLVQLDGHFSIVKWEHGVSSYSLEHTDKNKLKTRVDHMELCCHQWRMQMKDQELRIWDWQWCFRQDGNSEQLELDWEEIQLVQWVFLSVIFNIIRISVLVYNWSIHNWNARSCMESSGTKSRILAVGTFFWLIHSWNLQRTSKQLWSYMVVGSRW